MITWEDTPGKNSWPLNIAFKLYTVRCKHSKQDANSVKCFFSKRASNGEFRNNLQWSLTALCLECATAVYTQEKQVKAVIRWSGVGSLSAFHCCKLRCKILEIITDKREKGLQFCSFHIAAKQEAYGKEKRKNCLKVCSKHWTENWSLMRLFAHLLHVVTRDWFEHCGQQDIQLLQQGNFLARWVLQIAAWLLLTQQWEAEIMISEERYTNNHNIIHRIGHLDLELKAHQTHQEISHSFQWALDLTLIQCILGWDFICPDMH